MLWSFHIETRRDKCLLSQSNRTKLFASKRYNHIALIARRAEQLKIEEKAAIEAVGSRVKVKTFAFDVTDTDALKKTLDVVDAELGKPECVFYNAARVVPSQLLSHDVQEIEYDLKVREWPYEGNPLTM